MKKTLATIHEDKISHLFDPDGNSQAQYKLGILNIHTEAVSLAIDELKPNAVLGRKAPEVDKKELSLPRKTRVTLSQLRSGHSPFLQSYLHKIRPEFYRPNCPQCDGPTHDTNHLFGCPGNPTHLTVSSLWDDPAAAAAFLNLPLSEEDEDDDSGDGRQRDPG